MHALLIVNGAALEPPVKEVVVIRPVDKVGLDDLLLSVHEDVREAINALHAYRKTFERGNNARNSNTPVAVALDTQAVQDQHTRDIQLSYGPERNIRVTA